MTNTFVNKNIECSVTNCKNHCPNDNYCALKKICVGSTSPNPDKSQTDCCSFVEK